MDVVIQKGSQGLDVHLFSTEKTLRKITHLKAMKEDNKDVPTHFEKEYLLFKLIIF